MGTKFHQKLQLGKETTPGTAVAATTIWRGPGGTLDDTRTINRASEYVGLAMPTNRIYTPKYAAALAMASTEATFEQLPYILEAGIKAATPAQDGSGDGYVYEYALGTTSANTIRTYTIEGGDEKAAEEMEYAFVESFTLSGNAGEAVMMSANWIGRQVSTSTFTAALSVPAVEEILAGTGEVFIDDVADDFGDTQLAAGNVLSFTLNVNTGRAAKYTIDQGDLVFNHVYLNIDALDISGTLTWEHDTAAIAEKALWRSNTPRLLRLVFTGSAFAQAGTDYSNKTLLIDVPIYWEKFNPLGDQDGNSIVEASFKGAYDFTAAEPMTITVVNELTALP